MKKKMNTSKKHQEQKRPGTEKQMKPTPETKPIYEKEEKKLANKVAIITGGDSGIGKAIALLFAQEGANIIITYLNEQEDAKQTKKEVLNFGVECQLIKADLSNENNCKKVINKTIEKFNHIDILINNAALHWEQNSLEEITTKQLVRTFETNFYSYFWMSKYALPHMNEGSSIINSSSVTAYRGSDHLIDYAATKGAIISFTRSLAANLVEKKIRVNAVAPGPVWTPLIVSTFDEEAIQTFGSDTPMRRPAMPNEIAPSYLFLATNDSSFITGQVLHPNGGEINNT